MPQLGVNSTGELPVSADKAWGIVRDFCATWHPAIATMQAEVDANGFLTRAFTVYGDNTIYRERLTWFSDTERSMAYTHIEGINGVDSYDAKMIVSPISEDQCSLTLSAELTAAEPRATEIATGTKIIFDEAVTALSVQSELLQVSCNEAVQVDSHSPPQSRIIEGTPTLAVSVCDKKMDTSDTLCLFLHGIGGNRSNWHQQLSAVAPYCRTAALDLRGYGDSALGENQSTVDDYCDDILRVADSLGAKRLILCGLSYGAWIATSFAMRHPDRLAALVLSGGCTGMSEADNAERESFRRNREVPLSQGQTPADFAPAVLDVLAGPEISDSVKLELLKSMQAIPTKTYADALRCFTHPTEKFNFSSLNMPTLLITGEADRLAPPQEILSVAQRIHTAAENADVRYECLKRTGHVCNLEAPEAYNILLIELIQRVLR